MDQTYEATTVEMDNAGFEDLKNQIISGKHKEAPEAIQKEEKPSKAQSDNRTSMKKNVFQRGEDRYEIDDDYEIEMMADKKPVKMSLRELKERAAGDVAVKNRMHALAEEKKRVQATFKEFATLAKDDPLAALEYISSKANEADNEFEYQKYIEKLAEQAESLGKMDEKERKALELEKKLKKAEANLSQKERQEAVVLRKQEILAEYPEIGDSEFGEMVDAMLANPDLMTGVRDENGFMDRVEELVQETLTQRDIISVINEINPEYAHDNNLVFNLSDQLRLNPDLDEEDVRDIVRSIIGNKAPVASTKKDRDIRALSSRQRNGMGSQYREQNSSDYDVLMQQLVETKDKYSRTPITMR
jgi:plasmid stabilization system protein ParE